MTPRLNRLPAWQDFSDIVELADSELVGARFQFTYFCRGALKKHVASFDGNALLTGCTWGNREHTVVTVAIDMKRINMRPGCSDPIHVVREFWIADSSFPDGFRNKVVEEDLWPEENAPTTYSTVVINAIRGLSAYDLYIQQGGNLSLQDWLAQGGYTQEVMQTINILVTNLRETLGLDVEQAIQAVHQAMVDAADRAAAQAQVAAQSAQAAADSVQNAADLATAQATAQAQAAAAESVAAQEQAAASQQAAIAAASDLAEAKAKVAQILDAIAGLDPSQSPSDAIAAEAAQRAAADAEHALRLADLDHMLSDDRNETKFISRVSGAFINTTSNKIVSQSSYSVFYAPVKEGDSIRIKCSNSSSKQVITGFTSVLPAEGVDVDSVASQTTLSFDKTLTAPSSGYVVIATYDTYHINKNVSIGDAVSVQGLTIDTSTGVVADGGNTQVVYYIPTKAGYKFHITATNSSAKAFRYGFTADIPAVDVQVLSAQAVNVTNVDLDVKALQDGYLVLGHASAYFTDMAVTVYIPKLHRLEENANYAKEMIDDIAYAKLKYSIATLKKITDDGIVADASAENNRTLVADVTNFVGATLYLTGVLYAVTSGGTAYCWWVFQDENGNVVSKSEVSAATAARYEKVPVVVPAGAKTLYVQGSAASILPDARGTISSVVELLADEPFASKTTRTFALDFPCLSGNTGRITTSASATNKFNKHTPEYIKVHKSIKIKNLGGTRSVSVYFYDKNLNFISYTGYVEENGWTDVEVTDIPSNAEWFRISFYVSDSNVGVYAGYKKFEVDVESEWGYGKETTKEPYVEYQPFLYSVKANIPIKITEHSYTTKSVFGFDEGLIHLPSTYTHNGKPTPLIFLIHGDAERYTIGESAFSGHMKMQQCWSDAGFAQVDLDLIPSCYNEPTLASTGGTRDDLECLSAAWNWIITHYNIDTTGFYLIGRSRGGQAVCEILGKGGAVKLPIIAAISMAGANSVMAYALFSNKNRTEAMWQLWCNSRGLPTENRPSWSQSSVYSTSGRWLNDSAIYNFVSSNFDLWSKKELTGWGLITKNEEGITPRDYFDNFMYPYCQSNGTVTSDIEQFFLRMINTMEAKSPIPLRLDRCVGDETQRTDYFIDTPHSYSSAFSEILLNTPASNVEFRRWDGVDETNPYDETNPHYAENMIFYDGDVTLPNGVVTHNPSKVTMEWLIWCMGKDPRYQGLDYTLPWQ